MGYPLTDARQFGEGKVCRTYRVFLGFGYSLQHPESLTKTKYKLNSPFWPPGHLIESSNLNNELWHSLKIRESLSFSAVAS